jgi:nucleoside transporter
MTERMLSVRLAAMLFMETAVVAVYMPLLSIHMKHALEFSEEQVSYVYMVLPMTSLVAPVIAGWVADRYVAAQRLFGIVNLLRALALVYVAQAEGFTDFTIAMLLMSFVAWPSLTLAHAICFHHLPDPRSFGHLRVWGAVSWIVAVWMVSAYIATGVDFQQQLELTAHAFLFGAVLSTLLGLYSFSLPDTPPSTIAQNPLAFVDAFRLLRNRSFSVLMFAWFLMALAQPFNMILMGLFFTEQNTGLGMNVADSNRASSVAQLLELLLFPALAMLFHRFGLRAILFLGLAAWPLRFAAYAVGEPRWLVIAAQLLHGFNVVFGWVGTKIAVDLMAKKDIRASAQALVVMLCDGLGATLGLLMCGAVYAHYALSDGGHDWSKIYAVPLFISVAASAIFFVGFRNQDVEEVRGPEAAVVVQPSISRTPPA